MDTSGLDPSRLVVTVDCGWLGIEINMTKDIMQYDNVKLFNNR